VPIALRSANDREIVVIFRCDVIAAIEPLGLEPHPDRARLDQRLVQARNEIERLGQRTLVPDGTGLRVMLGMPLGTGTAHVVEIASVWMEEVPQERVSLRCESADGRNDGGHGVAPWWRGARIGDIGRLIHARPSRCPRAYRVEASDRPSRCPLTRMKSRASRGQSHKGD